MLPNIQDFCSRKALSNMTVSGPMATLVFPERTAPLAVLAASKLADVPLEIKPDAKLGKDAAPTLYFQGG